MRFLLELAEVEECARVGRLEADGRGELVLGLQRLLVAIEEEAQGEMRIRVPGIAFDRLPVVSEGVLGPSPLVEELSGHEVVLGAFGFQFSEEDVLLQGFLVLPEVQEKARDLGAVLGLGKLLPELGYLIHRLVFHERQLSLAFHLIDLAEQIVSRGVSRVLGDQELDRFDGSLDPAVLDELGDGGYLGGEEE